MTGLPHVHHLMRDLAHEVEVGRMTRLEAAGRVASHIHQALQCVHVTFWSVSGEIGRRVMRSVAAYDGPRDKVVAGAAAFPESGGGFFGAMVREGCYICPDTFADPALAGVKETMLVPFDIHSLLAASYGGNGEVWGLITCTGNAPRKWLAAEVNVLRKCASEISALRAKDRVLGKWLSTGGD